MQLLIKSDGMILFCLHSFLAAPSRPPENVQVNVRGPRSISVRWNRVPRQYENGRVRYYIIRVNSTVGTISISRSPATIYTLNPFTYYAVEVAAYTVELGPFSSLIAVRTAPDGTRYKLFA